ncbi:GNAT family acetyltransferase [Streptomyces chrestomyceticus JCM 4735]|uniref:GNAT family acetyltransferase n=1 Tax=Streptomyces chrestomyceticus JCM 4735 TaxID=1306181 RepID=A0A7U9Q1S2_9ACTN|nr:GNAT family N-acetyltransferase [Streptomyces chrestomyceticus]GCD39953.1 GNAT family acetyltransferase [Streptomyces chrestomyceticus JCM 4735]
MDDATRPGSGGGLARGGRAGVRERTRVRDFAPGDGAPLVAAWARSMPYDPVSRERFRRQVLLDPNFDPAGLRVAVRDGELVGAAYGVRRTVTLAGDDLEPEQGWIPFFFVDPAVRRAGLGRRLLTDVLDWLAAHGRTRVDFASYTPHYFLPGLDRAAYPDAARLLAELDFRPRGEAVAMDRSLVGHRVPDAVRERAAALAAEGYRFGTPRDDDLVGLLRLAGDEFGPDWPWAIRRALDGGSPLDRIVTAHDPSGRVVGWAMHGAYEGLVERFGPFGVRADQRGTGLGKVLLHLTLERMRAAGAHGAWFLWTGERSPAGQLYRSAGFGTTRTFEILRREVRP